MLIAIVATKGRVARLRKRLGGWLLRGQAGSPRVCCVAALEARSERVLLLRVHF